MAKKNAPAAADALPGGLAAPAIRALTKAGLTSLSRIAKATEGELLALHGFGPKAVSVLVAALEERGLALAPTANGPDDETHGKGRRS